MGALLLPITSRSIPPCLLFSLRYPSFTLTFATKNQTTHSFFLEETSPLTKEAVKLPEGSWEKRNISCCVQHDYRNRSHTVSERNGSPAFSPPNSSWSPSLHPRTQSLKHSNILAKFPHKYFNSLRACLIPSVPHALYAIYIRWQSLRDDTTHYKCAGF